MKLIYCKQCHDVVRLWADEERWCRCRQSGGRYINRVSAEYLGPCVPLGIDNKSLARVVQLWTKYGTPNYHVSICDSFQFEAFVIDDDCSTFKRVER